MPTLHPNRVNIAYLNYDIISGVLALISTICVSLRFVQRLRTDTLWWDDWTILSALALAIGVFITNVLATVPSIGAAGYHINSYSLEQLSVWANFVLAAEVLDNLSVSQSKLSVLLFFCRIFSVDMHSLIFTRVMFFLIVGITVSSVFGLIFAYDPVQAQWDFTIPHTTINSKAFYIISAVVNILLDVAIITFAQFKVWNLHLDLSRKLLLSLVFLVGGLTIISSILRVVYLETVDLDDPTYTLTTAGIWTNVEMYLSIICACLPTLYSLFRSLSRDKGRTGYNQSTTSYKSPSSLLTIGRISTKFNRTYLSGGNNDLLGSSGYEGLRLSVQGRDINSMSTSDTARVQTRYSASH
ncbi:hypothetical protein F5Y07DRAFT_380243 [Xylaria sp. FL0933]|nr:hypothetical protein F5Y07DRAFT_380243 [Xylaria sp. FL0933]